MKKKRCTKCKKIKKLDDFHKSSRYLDGHKSACKECQSQDAKRYTIKIKTKSKVIPNEKKCFKCNIVKLAFEFSKNKCSIDGLQNLCKQCYSEWYKDNFEKIKETQRNYRENNRDKLNKYHQERRKTDPVLKLRHRLGVLLRQTFLKKGIKKPKGVFRLLNYTVKEFVFHIENELKRGCAICYEPIKEEFHIAHRIPCSEAKNEKELIKLFALCNLTVAHPNCNLKLNARRIE